MLSRRAIALAGLLTIGSALLLLHIVYRSDSLSPVFSATSTSPPSQLRDVARRVNRMRRKCAAENPFERQYGRMNLRLSRGYEGSHFKMQQFIYKVLRGERVTISALGGSITKGHHVWDNEIWVWKFYEWLQDFVGDVEVIHANGAAPAVGSDYFSFCFPLHIPADSDLVMIELGVNDEAIPEHIGNMENLLRGILEMKNEPAVMLVEALAFSVGGMGGGGGRMHLPVAQFYDVPVINQRLPLANHFGRFPELIRPYFAQDYWGTPDTRHINSRGHLDLGMLVAAFVHDAACAAVSDPTFTVPHANHSSHSILPPHAVPDPAEADVNALTIAQTQDKALYPLQVTWPERTRSWRLDPSESNPAGQLMPGVFTTPSEFGYLPRQKVLDGWNPSLDNVVPPFHPVCLSTRSTNPQFNLTPSATEGWTHWVHPDFSDKPYLVATKPGSWAKFDLETGLGVVKIYALKSKTFGLGNIECWIGSERENSVEVEGWWDNGEANIGRFATVREGLPVGRHTLTCELLKRTSDPGGGTEFRLIGVMSL